MSTKTNAAAALPRFVTEAKLTSLGAQKSKQGFRRASYAFTGVSGFDLVWLESGEIVAVLTNVAEKNLTAPQRNLIASAYETAQSEK